MGNRHPHITSQQMEHRVQSERLNQFNFSKVRITESTPPWYEVSEPKVERITQLCQREGKEEKKEEEVNMILSVHYRDPCGQKQPLSLSWWPRCGPGRCACWDNAESVLLDARTGTWTKRPWCRCQEMPLDLTGPSVAFKPQSPVPRPSPFPHLLLQVDGGPVTRYWVKVLVLRVENVIY